MAPQVLIPLMMSPLMALAIWRRVRGQFGRQPIRRKRMVVRIAILAAVGGLLALGGLRDILLLEGLLGGLLAGAGLGLLGLRLTRFERDAQGADLYIPNAWIGGVLTVLLVGRLAWRLLVVMPRLDVAATQAAAPIGDSPLTLLLLGLMIGYYVSYYAGLLVHHRRFERAQAALTG
jgi:hypothetical protein